MSNPLYGESPHGADTIPGSMAKLPMSFWKSDQTPPWRRHPDNSDRWLSVFEMPLLDLRPEFAASDPNPTSAFPINRSPALGSGCYFRAMITNQPARWGDTRFFIRHEGHVNRAGAGVPIYRFTEDVEVTATVRAGGYSVFGGDARQGASVISAEPPGAGIRFWKVVITMIQVIEAPATTPRVYPIEASVM